MTLSIAALGPLIITIEGEPIKLTTKGKALLVYLAFQRGRAVSREKLADLLWPDRQSPQSRHSLRNCLLDLRNAGLRVASSPLVTGWDFCQLRNIMFDVEQFEVTNQAIDGLRGATALYRGHLLDHFPSTNSQPWDEWYEIERNRLEELLKNKLIMLSRLSLLDGDYETAVNAARLAVKIYPFNEYNRRFLMRVLERAGRSTEALLDYRDSVKFFKHELGCAPSAKSRELDQEIRERMERPLRTP